MKETHSHYTIQKESSMQNDRRTQHESVSLPTLWRSFITIMIILYMHMHHVSHARKYIIFEYACMLIRHMHVHMHAHICIACMYQMHMQRITYRHSYAHSLKHTLKHLVTSHSLMNSPISNCALVENVASLSEDETIW